MLDFKKSLSEIKYIIIWQIICVILVMLYGVLLCKIKWFPPFMSKRISDNKFFTAYTNGWAISHFIFYMILGYLYPYSWMYLFVSGIIWEITESQFTEMPFYMTSCYEKKYEKWWHSRYEDIIINTVGMIVGIGLHIFSRKTLRCKQTA